MNRRHNDEDFHITTEVVGDKTLWIEVLPKQTGTMYDDSIYCGIELAMFAQTYGLRPHINVANRNGKTLPQVTLFPSFNFEDWPPSSLSMTSEQSSEVLLK